MAVCVTAPTTLNHWRSVDAPFVQSGWQPESGTCSRCGGRAWRGQTIWWHHQQPCPSRGRVARFIPAPSGGTDVRSR